MTVIIENVKAAKVTMLLPLRGLKALGDLLNHDM